MTATGITMRCACGRHDACPGCSCDCHDPQLELLPVDPKGAA